MLTISNVFLFISLTLLLLASIGWPNASPIVLGWLGIFFYVLDRFVAGLKKQ